MQNFIKLTLNRLPLRFKFELYDKLQFQKVLKVVGSSMKSETNFYGNKLFN